MVKVRFSIGLPRCPVGGCASSTLPEVDALFVAACGVLGAAVGGALDPVGQRLADQSLAAEQRRRAERDARRAAEAAGHDATAAPGGPLAVPELDLESAAGTATPVRHLLPSGPSVGRLIGAALVTGGIWAAMAAHFGTHLVAAPFLVFTAIGVAVSVTDLSHRLVPRPLVFGALVLIVPLLVAVSAVDHTWHDLGGAAIAGAAAFAFFYLLWFFVPRGMGFGDVRLSGVIGLTVGYLSLLHAYLAFLFGFVLGLLFGVVLLVGASGGRKSLFPFAPALSAGAVVALLWGGPVAQHVFHAGS
jgi:leader peptidase (prepilin peptidase)/N-methyltransferase